jgi:hypothetical protein
MNKNENQQRAILEDIADRAMLERGLLPAFSNEAIAELVRLNDPADTAVICGYLWALTSAVSLPGTHIRVDPYFEGERLTGSLNAEIRSRLLWVVVVFINALREKPIRRLLKNSVGMRRLSRRGSKWSGL